MIKISPASGSNYTTYICHVTAPGGKITDESDKRVIEMIRDIVKKDGGGIDARGRHSDRKGLAAATGRGHNDLRRSVPVGLAEEVSLYARGIQPATLQLVRSLAKQYASK